MNAPRKASLAVLAGVAITGVVGAAAATLGDVTSSDLGSGDGAVESCNTDGVVVDFTTTWSGGSYIIDDVVVSSVDAACDGQDYGVVLSDQDGNELGEAVGPTDASGTFTASFSADEIPAEDVHGVSIVISG